MTEEVNPEVIKKTQDILGKFIKKPSLTEKLLKKPPFRFLHDICTSAMKETGFFEEMMKSPRNKIENIKDKEGKIEFLQKVISAVESANGIKLTIKASKIVAGLEPTKTNDFLQELGRALEKQLESKNSKPQPTKTKSNKKTSKEEPPDKKKTSSSVKSKKVIENGVHDTHEEIRIPDLPRKKHSSKKIEDVNGGKLKEEKARKISNGVAEEKEEKIQVERTITSGAGESRDQPDDDTIKVNGVDGQGDQEMGTKEDIFQDSETKKAHSGKNKHRRSSIQTVPDYTKVDYTLENNDTVMTESVENNTVNNKIILINKSETVLREQNANPPTSPGQLNFSKKEPPLARENTLISRPRTGIRPTTARPASARPAAPRIRDRGEVAVVEEVIKPASGKVQVIEEKEIVNEAEEENLISLETTNDILVEEPSPKSPPTLDTEQEHGHLVEQILEVQRELEDDGQLSEQKTIGKTEIEWESNRNKESTNREIEKLRSNIQTLTRTANPLGKLLDFFQEDIDTVQKELENWKEKNSSLSLQIAHERSITDQFVEPLKIHLRELQQSIDEQIDQITLVKANIIKNDEKIHKLLAGL